MLKLDEEKNVRREFMDWVDTEAAAAAAAAVAGKSDSKASEVRHFLLLSCSRVKFLERQHHHPQGRLCKLEQSMAACHIWQKGGTLYLVVYFSRYFSLVAGVSVGGLQCKIVFAWYYVM